MKLLLVVATPFEIAPTLQWLESAFESTETGQFTIGEHHLQVLVTGVGMVATAWQMGVYQGQQSADLLINAGIAGALDESLSIGQVCHVTEEQFADLGAEDASGGLLDLFDLNLQAPNDFPFSNKKMLNPQAATAQFLPRVRGISVNKSHGWTPAIQSLKSKFPDAQLESMEGAAFFWAALHAGRPFMQIRSVSNYVESRNRDNWNIPLAIQNLNGVLIEMIRGLTAPDALESESAN